MTILNRPPPRRSRNSDLPRGDGFGLAWFSAPYPYLPYRLVMPMYPRDDLVLPQRPLPRAYDQPVRRLDTGEYVEPSSSWRMWMPPRRNY